MRDPGNVKLEMGVEDGKWGKCGSMLEYVGI